MYKEIVKAKNGKVDEKWLNDVLTDNARRSREGLPLTDEYGAVCLRFVDTVVNNSNYGYIKLDKLVKAEICSRVYLALCRKAKTYNHEKVTKPSNWMFTMSKNTVSKAANHVLSESITSDIVRTIVGNDILSRLEWIDSNEPISKRLNERIAVLTDFKLNKDTKERIFKGSSRNIPALRDKGSLVRKAKRKARFAALKLERSAMKLTEDQNNELSRLLEARHNG